jgi:single-stranded DNA-binding protein
MGEVISRNARKGDQLIVEARVRANTWTDKQGEKQYDHTFVVQGFRFGAPGRRTREEFSQPTDQNDSATAAK